MGVWLAESWRLRCECWNFGGSQSFAGTCWKLALSSAGQGPWKLALKIACWPKVWRLALQIVCTLRIVETATGARNFQTQANWMLGWRSGLLAGNLAMQEVAANAFSAGQGSSGLALSSACRS
jgi:hypothetical protein